LNLDVKAKDGRGESRLKGIFWGEESRETRKGEGKVDKGNQPERKWGN